NGTTTGSNPYTVSQLEGAIGTNAFNVAIDVNTSGQHGETLQLFEVLVNGVVQYNYVGPTLIGNVANNDNGFADWLLSVVSLQGLAGTDTVQFHAVWNNASDGAESFFIIGVPGPLAGAGLPGLVMACGGLIALARRRRQQIV